MFLKYALKAMCDDIKKKHISISDFFQTNGFWKKFEKFIESEFLKTCHSTSGISSITRLLQSINCI